VERRFCDGIGAKEIPTDFPVTIRARHVLDFARGLTMHAQIGAARKVLLKDALKRGLSPISTSLNAR